MEQKLYKTISYTIPSSALEEWERMEEEIRKTEVSLFRYAVPDWVIRKGGKDGKS